MLISQFLRALESQVPLTAVGYARDAVGLQVGLPKSTKLTAALFAYEVTPEVILEARKRGANLIVAFHPLIFPSIDGVTDKTRTGALIRELIKQDIALYIQHTAFDTHPEFSTSRLMAEALKLEKIQTLSLDPRAGLRTGLPADTGMGAIGVWQSAQKREEVLRLISKAFKSKSVRYNNNGPERIKSVALLGGAGMDYYTHAVTAEADAFITADVRYHDFYRADHDKILLIDAGHAETERFVTCGMLRAAMKALGPNQSARNTVKPAEKLLLLARSEPNAVRYFSS